MPIQVVAVGKKHEPWIIDGVERYQKRLKRPYDLTWVFLPHSAREGLQARQDESERMYSRLSESDFVVLLDERGKMLDSPGISEKLTFQLERSKNIVVIIGGAYGVDNSIHERADLVWSLSKLVFPHQLVRLILVEQLYRAQEIFLGNPYHHE